MLRFLVVAALAFVAMCAAAQAQHVTRDTKKEVIIASLATPVATFDRALTYPVSLHWRSVCSDWAAGTVRPPICNNRQAQMVKRALLGQGICKTYLNLLMPGTVSQVWLDLPDADISLNNDVVVACIIAANEVEQLEGEKLLSGH